MSEAISIQVSKPKIGVAAAIFIFAIGMWYWGNRNERAIHEETNAALKNEVFLVRCSACGETFEIPATEFEAKRGPEGVTCIHCGQPKAWRIGSAGADPAQFRDEVAKIDSVGDVRTAIDATQAEYDRIHEQLMSPEVESNPEKAAELRKQQVPLQAKLQALNMRWDELNTH